MMKKPILFAVVASFFFLSCSKEDDKSDPKTEKVCETCIKGSNELELELCDNGDGTFTRFVNGEFDDTFTKKQLEDAESPTFELWVEINCR